MDHPFSMFKEYFYSCCRCNKRFGTQLQAAQHISECTKIKRLTDFIPANISWRHLSGTTRFKVKHIRDLSKKSMDLCSKFKEISFNLIDRKLNSMADKLANKAMKLCQNILEYSCKLCWKEPLILTTFSKENSKKTRVSPALSYYVFY